MEKTVSWLLELRVRDLMCRDVVSVSPDDTVHEALDLMVENRVSALPVVDGRRHCVGILSTTDLMDLTRELDTELEHYDEHLWLEREIKTVANVTAQDIREFLVIAAEIPIYPQVTTYRLEEANRALCELKRGRVKGEKVLVVR